MPIRRPAPFMDGGNALHLDGAVFGYVPNATEPLLDTSADCALPIERAPWVHVRVAVPELVARLVGMGLVNETVAHGAVLTGGIVLGPETWGRHRTVAEVTNRTIWLVTQADSHHARDRDQLDTGIPEYDVV